MIAEGLLTEANRDRSGDLRPSEAVVTDYRDVLAEIVQKRLGNDALDAVFPDYEPAFLGLADPLQPAFAPHWRIRLPLLAVASP